MLTKYTVKYKTSIEDLRILNDEEEEKVPHDGNRRQSIIEPNFRNDNVMSIK
jgi:hypothetical protein